MFTGLVEDTGEIMAIVPRGRGIELSIRTKIPLEDVDVGASIAVNGVCLTAESFQGDRFIATAGAETLRLTNTGALKVGSRVHLERALRVGDRLGGHLVQGHVDGMGVVVSTERQAESWVVWIELPVELARYVAAKGSICIDGVSLTVNEVRGRRFRVNIVPHTSDVTAVTRHAAGERVNIEVDILAKYVERLLGAEKSGGLTLDFLKQHGFAK